MLEKGYDFYNYKSRDYQPAHLSTGDATINECLFTQYARKYANVDKHDKSKDFIIMEFEYDVHEDNRDPDNIKPNVSKEDVRRYLYENDATIAWPIYSKETGEPIPGSEEVITYRMLVRSPGKAKTGECIFANVRDGFHKKMLDYLTMGLWEKIPIEENAKIVELSAYAPLIMGTAIDYIKIPLKNIFVLKDETVSAEKKACVVRKGENGGCAVDREDSVKIENVMWDGMGVIDESIFPEDKDGFIYCRSHFFKSCLFRGNIQQYFMDYYGEDYSNTKLKDYTGRNLNVSDIKVIVTEKSLKWEKFLPLIGKDNQDMKTGWRYFRDIMRKYDEQFAIVKTGHKSKYDDSQRMSYQMVNSLLTTDEEVLRRIAQPSITLFNQMQVDDDKFIDFLEKTEPDHYNFKAVMVALYRYNKDFRFTELYKTSKSAIMNELKDKRFKQGKLLLEGDNLTICSNVIALLMAVTGQDFKSENCFEPIEDGVQCYTERFQAGERLAGFRNPHNSPNNIIHLQNVYPEELRRYFPKLGKHVIVINGIGTDVQARLNGADYDTDCVYTTNQPDVVVIARRAYMEFPTIVNAIPPTSNSQYKKDMRSYAQMDIGIAGAQILIGKASNSAQLAMSYWHDGGRTLKELEDAFIILSVLAQLAIDSAKRCFDVDIQGEIDRINKMPCMKQKPKYPKFYADVQIDKNRHKKKRDRKKIDKDKDARKYDCPMDIIYKIFDDELLDKREHKELNTETISTESIFDSTGRIKGNNRTQAQKIKSKILEYQKNYKKLDGDSESYSDDRKRLFDDCMSDLRKLSVNQNTMKSLIKDALTDKRIKSMRKDLLVVLYDKDPESFLKCFKKS
ncbi:MAG: hypothetical protein LUD12_12300 [Lachnospiraceae bacterium]|nr:hypothetical protein [Lachnospiraceae bacterium]